MTEAPPFEYNVARHCAVSSPTLRWHKNALAVRLFWSGGIVGSLQDCRGGVEGCKRDRCGWGLVHARNRPRVTFAATWFLRYRYLISWRSPLTMSYRVLSRDPVPVSTIGGFGWPVSWHDTLAGRHDLLVLVVLLSSLLFSPITTTQTSPWDSRILPSTASRR